MEAWKGFLPLPTAVIQVLADVKKRLRKEVSRVSRVRITREVTSPRYGSLCHPVGVSWQKQVKDHCSWDILINIDQTVQFLSPGKIVPD